MTVTTRRERRQQQRRQQQRRATGGGSRGFGGLWIGLIVIAVLVGLVFVARAMGWLEAPTSASGVDVDKVDISGQVVGEKKEDIGNAHVASGEPVTYPSLPPTSGMHWPAPAAPAPWGIKTSKLPFEVTTHNLEHGGIVIMYGPDMGSGDVEQLRTTVRSLQSAGFNKIVLEPWPDMPKESKVILTAWDWILKLPGIDQTQVIKFVRQHHSGPDAPEANVP